MEHHYTYEAVLAASEKVHWRVEDLIGGDKRLDFRRRFMPESLARVEPLSFLSAEEKRTLNQIRGHGYLSIFGLVEEFIVPFVLDQTRPQLDGDDYRTRALLAFAGEGAKHIHLFKRFRAAFEQGFGMPCGVIGPPHQIARAVLSHHPLAVALVTLQIEWMTQRHYTESVRDDHDLASLFASLLRHHWMEEAQHSKLDTLMIEALVAASRADAIDTAREDYGKIRALLDGGLQTQVQLALASFERAIGRTLTESERAEFFPVQRQAARWTFLGSGMTHPKFLATLGSVRPAARQLIEATAPTFS